jgi:monoterpene epsilon-lactone hydrolase
LIQIHGGCYVLNPAEAALPEAMLIAAMGGYRVIAVDYRMPPKATFPRHSMIRWPCTRT